LQRVGALDQLAGRIKNVVMGLAVKVGARQDAPGRVVGKAIGLALFVGEPGQALFGVVLKVLVEINLEWPGWALERLSTPRS
jgi:hypothetical protein